MKKVITYGTFDLFHIGHLRLLSRLKSMGDYLIVAVSTDEFNQEKGKRSVINFNDRVEILKNLRIVDEVIPERSWDQKRADIENFEISIFGMGSDWSGKFDFLNDLCEVVYLDRTEGVSSTIIKQSLSALDKYHLDGIKEALDTASQIIDRLG